MYKLLFILLFIYSCSDDNSLDNQEQDSSIRGYVLDASNNPIANADVYITYDMYTIPSRPSTTISFNIVESSNVSIWIEDGCDTVKTLVDSFIEAGVHTTTWDATNDNGERVLDGGYIRTGFECYSLPDSPMTKAFNEGEAHYGASGHQPGGRVNFIAVGSSSMSNLGNDYYVQNFYDILSYKKALDKNFLPSFRGKKLSLDDKIRQHATQQIRSYFKIDFNNFKEQFDIDFKKYFVDEIKQLDDMINDGLLELTDKNIVLSEIGKDFVQNIMNVFDKYDPPSKSYKDRLETVKRAKESQATVQEKI